MSKKTVIFLGGEQGSGKSTAAEFIKCTLNSMGSDVAVLKFADTVYDIHNAIENMLSGIIGRTPLKKRGELLQVIGTEIGRNMYDKNIWVKETKQRILNAEPEGSVPLIIIVEDVRFKNEFDLSAELSSEGIDSFSIYFGAPEEIRKERVESFRTNTAHPSEADLANFKDLFDYKVDTSGTMGEKNTNLNNILNERGLLPLPETILSAVVANFNENLEEWESLTGCGANFEWFYTESGKKRLRVKEVAPISTLPPDKAAVVVSEVQKFMETLDG